MPVYRFPAEAGQSLENGPPTAPAIAERLDRLGLARGELRVSRHGDAATLEGLVPDGATRERILLAVGNLAGIARVDDRLTVAERRGLMDALSGFAHLPAGSASTEAAGHAVHRAVPEPETGFGPGGSMFHTVQAGETLAAIAQRHYGDTAAAGWILESNAPVLPDEGSLKPGLVLRLPPR